MIIKVNNLTKLYKNKKGIDDISFSLDYGQIMGLLGPNGAGKSTLLKVLVKIIKPQQGNVTILGKDISIDDQYKKYVGCLIEDTFAYQNMSASQNLSLISLFYEDKLSINEVLDIVELKNTRQSISKYSLGMKQKFSIAMALINKPKLLILDEPLNALDIESNDRITKNLIEYVKMTNASIIISSHMVRDLQDMCDTIAIINNTKLIKFEKLEDILKNFGNLSDFFLDSISMNNKGMA